MTSKLWLPPPGYHTSLNMTFPWKDPSFPDSWLRTNLDGLWSNWYLCQRSFFRRLPLVTPGYFIWVEASEVYWVLVVTLRKSSLFVPWDMAVHVLLMRRIKSCLFNSLIWVCTAMKGLVWLLSSFSVNQPMTLQYLNFWIIHDSIVLLDRKEKQVSPIRGKAMTYEFYWVIYGLIIKYQCLLARCHDDSYTGWLV